MYYTALTKHMPGFLSFLLMWIAYSGLLAQGVSDNVQNSHSQKVLQEVEERKSISEETLFCQPFTIDQSKSPIILAPDVLTEATILQLDQRSLSNFIKSAEGDNRLVTLTLPFKSGGSIELELIEVRNLTDDFVITTSDGEVISETAQLGKFYRGVCKNKPESIAAFSFFDNQIVGMFSDETGNHIISRIPNDDRYVMYADEDLQVKSPFACQSDHLEHPVDLRDGQDDDDEGDKGFQVQKCINVYMEVDHALYLNKKSVTESARYIAAVFNNVSALYHNESITLLLSEVFVWTTKDPYSTTSSTIALNQFRSNRTSYNGTIAHLAALGGKNLGGVAWLDVLCFPNFRYGYSNIHSDFQNIPMYSWTVEVIAHEIGHNLGSRHTQWCGWPGGPIDGCFRPEGVCDRGPTPENGGTIMSYCHLTSNGINFANGFGPLPGNQIRNRVNKATCLTSCFVDDNPVCQRPGGLKIEDITFGNAKISWIPGMNVERYTVKYKSADTTITTWKKLYTDTCYISLESLLDNQDYLVQVLAECDSVTTSEPSAVFSFKTASESDYCNGKAQSSKMQWISMIDFGSIKRVSGDDGGYYDGTDMSTELEPGKTYILKFQSDVVVGPVALFWRMWIDYDGNGSFVEASDLVFGRATNTTNPLARAIHIPADAKIGTTRLRFALKYGGHAGPCEVFGEGEVEDFTVHIVPRGSSIHDTSLEAEMEDGISVQNIYPNPVLNDLITVFDSDVYERGEISVVNMLGQIVARESFESTVGRFEYPLNLESLSPGSYSLLIKIGNRVMQHKFVKI